jgi:hypothetical protein
MLLRLALLAVLVAPQTADPTLPSANVRARFTVEGIGVQVYHCVQQNGAFIWEFQEPAATLFDPATHQQVGMHAAGPTWTWADGSAITGKVVQKQPATDPANIPWLLLQASPSGDTTGALTGITLVRRSNTAAGIAPASTVCDAQNLNVVLKVPYQATYTFYEPAK